MFSQESFKEKIGISKTSILLGTKRLTNSESFTKMIYQQYFLRNNVSTHLSLWYLETVDKSRRRSPQMSLPFAGEADLCT